MYCSLYILILNYSLKELLCNIWWPFKLKTNSETNEGERTQSGGLNLGQSLLSLSDTASHSFSIIYSAVSSRVFKEFLLFELKSKEALLLPWSTSCLERSLLSAFLSYTEKEGFVLHFYLADLPVLQSYV